MQRRCRIHCMPLPIVIIISCRLILLPHLHLLLIIISFLLILLLILLLISNRPLQLRLQEEYFHVVSYTYFLFSCLWFHHLCHTYYCISWVLSPLLSPFLVHLREWVSQSNHHRRRKASSLISLFCHLFVLFVFFLYSWHHLRDFLVSVILFSSSWQDFLWRSRHTLSWCHDKIRSHTHTFLFTSCNLTLTALPVGFDFITDPQIMKGRLLLHRLDWRDLLSGLSLQPTKLNVNSRRTTFSNVFFLRS